MLLPLLAVCGFGATTVWRVSSAIIAMVLLCYGATYPMRRGAMVAGPLPRGRRVPIVAVSVLIVVALIGNAIGFPYGPALGPVALAASWTLGCGAVIFVLALNAFWGDTPKAKTGR